MQSPYDFINALDRLDRLSSQLVDELFLSIHHQIMAKLDQLIINMEDEFPSPTTLAYRHRIFSKFMARLVANYVRFLQHESKQDIDTAKIMNQLMLDVSRYINDALAKQIT